jgi:hypothetical protein
MWSSNFILGPRSNSALIPPKNGLQDAWNCARHLFDEMPRAGARGHHAGQQRPVARRVPGLLPLGSALMWSHLSSSPSLAHSLLLPAPILSARARRARPRHGQPGGACYRQRSCSSIAPFSSLTPPSASRGSRRATPLPLGRCAAPPRGRRSEAAAVSPARVARRPRTSTGPAVGGHGSASPPCSFRAAPSLSVAGSRPARPPAVFPLLGVERKEKGKNLCVLPLI